MVVHSNPLYFRMKTWENHRQAGYKLRVTRYNNWTKQITIYNSSLNTNPWTLTENLSFRKQIPMFNILGLFIHSRKVTYLHYVSFIFLLC